MGVNYLKTVTAPEHVNFSCYERTLLKQKEHWAYHPEERLVIDKILGASGQGQGRVMRVVFCHFFPANHFPVLALQH